MKRWIAKAFVNGEWVIRCESDSKFVAALSLTNDEIAGRKTVLIDRDEDCETQQTVRTF